MLVGGNEHGMHLLMASLLCSLALQRVPGGREPRSHDGGECLWRLCERLRLMCIHLGSFFDEIETQTRSVSTLANFLGYAFHVIVSCSSKQTLSQRAYPSECSRNERDSHHQPYPKDSLLGRGEVGERAMQETEHVLLEPRGEEMMCLPIIP